MGGGSSTVIAKEQAKPMYVIEFVYSVVVCC
jgi:hypothetical protein